MSQTIDADAPLAEGVHFLPGPGYRMLGGIAAVGLGVPMLIALLSVGPAAAPIVIAALLVAIACVVWVTTERAWAGPEGVWIKSLPLLRERFVPWQQVAELALPTGSLRSPWMWLTIRERVRLPMFVDSEQFADAVAIFAPDVMARTSDVILHTDVPRGRWIEGVWMCDAHRRKWCAPCNAEAAHRPHRGGCDIDLG